MVAKLLQTKFEQRSIVFKMPTKLQRLIGAVLYGDTADGIWHQELLENKTDLSTFRDKLVFRKAYAL